MGTYKDSGIEWIGEIPNEWDVNKIKYTSTLHGRIGWQGLTSEEYIDEGPYLITGTDFQNGEIDWDSCVHISEERWAQADKIQIKDGDLLITKDGTVGKTAIVTNLNDKASLNSGVLLINLQTHSKKYLYWLLNSKVFWEWFDITNSGNSTILHLYQKDFDNFSFPIPPLQEQAAIANFLDKKSAEIDAIVGKITHQIQMLKDYRHSLITETVTKGLDKTVTYKDSGIEWIGEIPEEWEIIKIKHAFKLFAGGDIDYNDYSEEQEGVYQYPILANSLENSGIIGFTSKYRFSGETITITGRGSVGVAFYRNFPYFPVVRLLVGVPIRNLSTKYVTYSINSFDTIGEQTAMTQLTTDKLGVEKIPLPPLREQTAIAEFLDDKTTKIDGIIAKKEQQLEIIKEHRKSLIYEYVTGKKRVKEYQQDGN